MNPVLFLSLVLTGLQSGVVQTIPPGIPGAPPVEAPYSKLFAPDAFIQGKDDGSPRFRIVPPVGPPGRAVEKGKGPRSKVVCGTTIIYVDPQADPSMTRPAPAGGVHYTMRRVPPSVCGSEK